MKKQQWKYNDGGRLAAGYTGQEKDSVVRAIAIATEQPYRKVYEDLSNASISYAASHKNDISRKIHRRGPSLAEGVYKVVYEAYLLKLGWRKWDVDIQIAIDTSKITPGQFILILNGRLVAYIKNIALDTSNYRKFGGDVLGYYYKPIKQ